MDAKDIYTEEAREDVRRSGRRFAIILAVSILLLFALTVGALYALFSRKLRERTPPAQSAAPASNSAGQSELRIKDYVDRFQRTQSAT